MKNYEFDSKNYRVKIQNMLQLFRSDIANECMKCGLDINEDDQYIKCNRRTHMENLCSEIPQAEAIDSPDCKYVCILWHNNQNFVENTKNNYAGGYFGILGNALSKLSKTSLEYCLLFSVSTDPEKHLNWDYFSEFLDIQQCTKILESKTDKLFYLGCLDSRTERLLTIITV